MNVAFSSDAWSEYQELMAGDAKHLARLNKLIEECRRSPFEGTGKPEPLRGKLQGWWSRRITQQDRLVYRVSGKGTDQTLEIIQCQSHY